MKYLHHESARKLRMENRLNYFAAAAFATVLFFQSQAWAQDLTTNISPTVNVSSTTTAGTTTFTPTGAGANLDWQDVETALGAGDNINVTTTGNITAQTGAIFLGIPSNLTFGVNAGGTLSLEFIETGGATGDNIQLSGTTSVIEHGLDAEGGNIAISGGTLTLAGALNQGASTVGNVDLQSTSTISAAGPIKAVTLTGSSTGSTTLNGTLGLVNLIATLGTFTANSFSLTNGQALTISGTLTGTTGITLNDTFGITVTGAVQTTTGSTTIGTNTTLQIGNGTTVGSITGAITDNGTLVYDHSNSVTTSSVISGTGGLTQLGASTLTLTGNNTYQGATTISASTLAIGAGGSIASSSGVNLTASGTIFDISTGGNQTIKDLSGVSGSTVNLGSNTLTVGTANSTTFAGTIQDLGHGGGLTKQGTGTLNLTGSNSYTGQTIVNGGTLSFNGGGSESGTSQVIVGQNNSDNGTLKVGGNGAGTLTSGAGSIGDNSGSTGTATVDGSTSVWTLTGNGQGFNDPGAVLYVGQSGTGTLNIQNGGTVTLTGQTGTVSIGANANSIGTVNVGSLSSPSASTSTLSDSGSNVTNGFSGNFYLGYSGTGTLNIYSDGHVTGFDGMDVAVTTGSSGTLNVNGGTLDFSPNTAGNLTVGDAGVGTMTISNGGSVSNYAGTIAQNVGSAGSSATVTGTNSRWSNNVGLFVGTSDAGSLTISNGGKVTDGGQLYISQQSTIGSTSTVTVDAGTLNVTQDIIVGQGGTGIMKVKNGGQVTSDSAEVGAGGFAGLVGTGQVTVTGTGSSWDTGTTDTFSSLSVGEGGLGTVSVSSGGKIANSYVYINEDGTTNNDTVTVDGTGSQFTATGNIYTGLYGTGGLTISNGGLVSDVNGIIGYTSTSANTILTSTTSSIGTVTVTGAGSTWTNSSNIFVGDNSTNGGNPNFGTGISTGTLNIENGGTVSGATLFLAKNTGAVGTLNIGSAGTPTTGGTLTVNAVTFGAGTGTINFNQTDAFALSATISGTGTVNQQGTGTTTLSIANTYSGTTTISAGTLLVKNNTALGTSNVSVTGGTLSIGDGTALQTLAVGGTYTQGAGTLALALHSNTASDQVNVTSTASLNGTLAVNFNGNPTASAVPGSPSITTSYTLLTSTGLTGTFSTFDPTNVPVTDTVVLAYINNDVVLNVSSPAILFPTTGANLTPNQQAVLTSINTGLLSSNSYSTFINLTSALGTFFVSNPGSFGGALDQLTPLDFEQYVSSTAFNNASFLMQQFDDYMANHRGTDGTFVASADGIDYSGLSFNDPNVDSALQTVHSRLLAWSPAPGTGLLSDSSPLVLGGVDMKDAKKMVSANEPENRWNVFVSGNVVLAQDFSDPSVGLAHTNASTSSVQIGADYRIDSHFLIGAMFGYGHSDATLDTLGSSATADTYSPAVYAGYVDGGWYANALGSYGFNNYTQDRNVSIGAFNGTAHSAPTGDQVIGNLDGGYDFHRKGWTFGPTAGLQYVHLDVNGFGESGLPGADLTVNRSETDSLRSRLGGRLEYAVQDGEMIFTPHLSASWQHEFMDQGRGITASFNDVAAGSFSVRTANPGRDSALVDVGFDAQIDKTWTVFTDYTVQAGQDNYFGQSVQAGVKIGF